MDHLARDESLGYRVNHLARLLEHALRDRIAPFGVVPGQFPTLLSLWEADGLTQAELCASVRIEQPTMANTLARMERDGLIKRIPDPDDRRRSLVLLTPKARSLERPLGAEARAVNAIATGDLDAARVTELLGVLATIIGNLEAAKAEATS